MQVADPAWTTKDLLQVLALLFTAVGVVVTAFKVRADLRLARQQRDRDLRWKQAEAGKKLNDEMQEDDRAWPALQMLDSAARRYTLPDGTNVVVTTADVRAALDTRQQLDDPKSEFVRDCFDSLLYFIAAMDHYIGSSLVHPDDVAYPIEYYLPRLEALNPELDRYISQHGLTRVRTALANFHDHLRARRLSTGAPSLGASAASSPYAYGSPVPTRAPAR